jgi:uncharacterized protein (TIGR03083 family)
MKTDGALSDPDPGKPDPKEPDPGDPDPGDIDIDAGDIGDIDIGETDYMTHLARNSARFVEVLRQAAPQTRVPTCPEWDADDLLWHLGEGQRFWATVVGRGLTAYADVEDLDNGERPGDRDGLFAYFDHASADLHHALSTTSPGTPAWTWCQDETVGFIRRRQAHEALIHRIDAELTAGDRTPMDTDLSADGVDEALHFMDAGLRSWGRIIYEPAQTIRVETTDTDDSWLVTLGRLTGIADDGTAHDDLYLTVAETDDDGSDSGEPAAATMSGAAADLDCWLWNRPPVGQVERTGDPAVLERFDRTITAAVN